MSSTEARWDQYPRCAGEPFHEARAHRWLRPRALRATMPQCNRFAMVKFARRSDHRVQQREEQMFNVGTTYIIKVLEDAAGESEVETEYGGCKVIDVQWPCIKYEQGRGDETILNVASPRFVSAKPDKR
jgi:hypothetical protein